MEMVTSSRPVNGGAQTGPSGVAGTPSQGIAQACRGAAFGQRAQAGIHQSDLHRTAAVGSQAPAALSEHQPKAQPKALADVRCTSFQFSKFSLTFHL